MQVPILTMCVLCINLILSIALPVAGAVYLHKKYRASVVPFFIGMAAMVVFALILEQLVHSLVLATEFGMHLRNNPWGIALYGGLMAGLFEETARLLAMKLLLRKHHGNQANGLMYGVGHGGIEIWIVFTLTMVNNLIFAVLLNTGNAAVLTAPLQGEALQSVQSAFDALATTSASVFLLGLAERVAAFAAQIALSALVWLAAVKTKKIGCYLLAIALHAVLDAVAGVLNGYGVSVWIVEAAVWVLAGMTVWIAVILWRRGQQKGENEYEAD